jgi:hypothetical protein
VDRLSQAQVSPIALADVFDVSVVVFSYPFGNRGEDVRGNWRFFLALLRGMQGLSRRYQTMLFQETLPAKTKSDTFHERQRNVPCRISRVVNYRLRGGGQLVARALQTNRYVRIDKHQWPKPWIETPDFLESDGVNERP